MMTIQHICVVCWMTMAADTHSEYVTPSACPLQRRLHELATALRPLRVLFALMTVSAKPSAVFARVLCFSATLRLRSVGRCAALSCVPTCCFASLSRHALNCKLTFQSFLACTSSFSATNSKHCTFYFHILFMPCS
jgi:hypothetical protein